MTHQKNLLGTTVLPADLHQAARRHGRALSRYLLARSLAAGKRVLDAACGGGYGSACLAAVAANVLGVDLDDPMLRHASKHFSAPNLEFRKHDLHEPLAGAGPFDLITLFEALEHVADPSLCLARLASSLAQGGTAIISVPNGTKEARDAAAKTYHPRQFSADDFRKLLEARFEQVELLSQVYHKGPGHYLRKLVGGGHHASNYRFEKGLSDSAKTWLAICRRPRRA